MNLDFKIDETIIQILNDKKIVKKYTLSQNDRESKNKRVKHKEGFEGEPRQQQQLHFNGISEALKEHYRPITNRILSLHLNRLEDQGIIERSEFKPGLARFYRLSENRKLALQLELPIEVKSERGEFSLRPEKHTDKDKKMYLLLLSLATIGVSVPQPVEDDLHTPLGAFYDKKQNKAFTATTPLPDIAASDFFHKYRDFSNGWRFRYLKFKDISEVEWYFKTLTEFKPPILKPAGQIEWIKKYRLNKNLKWPPVDVEKDEETRYGIADKKLRDFMQLSIGLFGDTEMVMRYTWRYRRKQTLEEIEWYTNIYGEDHSKDYFLQVNGERSRLEGIIGKTAGKRKSAKAAANADYKVCHEVGDFQSPKYMLAVEILNHFAGIETIDRIKSSPYYWHQKLTGEEYRYVHSNYGIIADMLMNIAYPDFMKNIFQPKQ